MPIENWDRIQDLFLAAADLAAPEQVRFLDTHCGANLALRREVESLLAADQKTGEEVTTAVETEAQSLLGITTPVGARLGAYRVIREIGRGGMGTVYLAIRDDDQYRKQVAIKLIRQGMDTADVLDRFRHERQILANLDHPYIARLIDGGTSPDGRPFFVMDYVEGLPVDTFCREHRLDTAGRCRLFLQICEAVSHAHRNLVVHRDLKPSNIFVNADGTPKLLDFGVAKLLNPDAESGFTATVAARPLTPEYASPEQVRALAVNTTTDVYSLGAILYELLTGTRAHAITTRSPLEIERAICENEVRRPSLQAPGLDTDFDNIIAMAMRKEPERRYQSVDHLSEDIRRHLNKRPVLARPDSLRYRAGKFVRRNRVAIAGAALFAAVLIGGATTSAIEARRATREQARAEEQRRRAVESQARAEASRQEAESEAHEAGVQRQQAELQRIAAETQRQVADRRFQQVRQLAGKFLLEFHDAIARLPGSTAARKMVVQTGLQYYDTLVKEAHGNRDLLEEIARGYDRLGDVQGNPYFANLGDSSGALDSYRKALAIRQSVSDDSPEFLRDRIGGNVKVAQMLSVKGDVEGADRTLRDTILLAERATAADAYMVRIALTGAYRTQGDNKFRTGDVGQSIGPFSKLLDLWTQLARDGRDPEAAEAGLAVAHAKLADALCRLNRNQESLDHLRIAVDIDKKLVAADRNSIPRLRKLYIDYTLLSLTFRHDENLAAPGEPRAVNETAADLSDQMLAADPNNSTALFDVMTGQTLIGDWLRDHNDPDAAVIHYRRAVDIVEKFAATGTPALLTQDSLIYAHQRLAAGLGKAGRLEESLEHCRKADEYLARVEERNPGLLNFAARRAYVASTRADAYAQRKVWKEAIAAYRAADDIFADLRRRDPKNESYLAEQTTLRIQLADCYAALEQWSGAVQTMQTALDRLGEIASRRPLLAEEQREQRDGSAKLAAWKQK